MCIGYLRPRTTWVVQTRCKLTRSPLSCLCSLPLLFSAAFFVFFVFLALFCSSTKFSCYVARKRMRTQVQDRERLSGTSSNRINKFTTIEETKLLIQKTENGNRECTPTAPKKLQQKTPSNRGKKQKTKSILQWS